MQRGAKVIGIGTYSGAEYYIIGERNCTQLQAECHADSTLDWDLENPLTGFHFFVCSDYVTNIRPVAGA